MKKFEKHCIKELLKLDRNLQIAFYLERFKCLLKSSGQIPGTPSGKLHGRNKCVRIATFPFFLTSLGESVIFNKLDCSDLAHICTFLLARCLIHFSTLSNSHIKSSQSVWLNVGSCSVSESPS